MNSQNPDWITRIFGKDLVVSVNDFADEMRKSGRSKMEIEFFKAEFEREAGKILRKRVSVYSFLGSVLVIAGIYFGFELIL